MLDLREHPGQIYLAVTLLPLASFLLIGLAAALRAYLRAYRETPLGEGLYNLLGGDNPKKGAAYVATAAIGLSCVLALIGFIQHATDQHDLEQTKLAREHEIQKLERDTHEPGADEHALEHKIKQAEESIEVLESRWAQHFNWIHLRLPDRFSDPDRGTTLQLGYKIDTLSATMFLMVTFIATLIHVFSIGYMGDELAPTVEDHQVHTEEGHLHRRGRFGRFFMFLSLFCFSMLNLVLADNLFQVFVSWELVGICSYLLIGFYFERKSAANAANKAFITNRVGDAGFIIGLLVIWTYVGSFNFEDIFHTVRAPLTDSEGTGLVSAGQMVRAGVIKSDGDAERVALASGGERLVLMPRNLGHFHKTYYDPIKLDEKNKPILDENGNAQRNELNVHKSPKKNQHGSIPYWMWVVAGLGIFLGCVGKSAQFPLQVWLPDAMEGPTPVSALIHAATMVAAGVYLVGRCYPMFTADVLLVIAYTGGITLFVAATIAIVMTDIKKVLAYSTVSQLGYMMLALGVGGWVAGLFHLLTHAFFKALLFLGSGSVIYGCHHEQEMTRMGGLYPKMKITAITMLVGVLAIAGIPLFSGWYSKDAILAQALGFVMVRPQHALLFVLPLITAGITTFYMFRMWFMTFTGKPRDEHVHEHAHESPRLMTVPLIVLAVCSVVVAWGWPIWDAEQSALEHHLHHSQYSSLLADFGGLHEEPWPGATRMSEAVNTRAFAQQWHSAAGYLALLIVGIGIAFAAAIYWFRVLDPAEAAEQVPGLHAFLKNKWYFDELYSVVLVRPAMIAARWCRAFDTYVIDGTIHCVARTGVLLSKWDGWFDHSVIDGLANLVSRVAYAIGNRLRNVQTGYLRSYVLFLALAAVGAFILLLYVVRVATAG